MSVTATQLTTLGVVVAIFTGIIGVYFLARQASREAASSRQKEIDRAVNAATEPIKAELAQMTDSRNYYRRRASDFEAELRRRGQ